MLVRADENRRQSNNGNFHFCRFWRNELSRVRYRKKRGMFFAAERNAINVEIQAFRNLTYNATLRARGSSIESKNKFYPPVLPLAQQIVFDYPTVKYLPFARSGLLPPNTIVPRKLVLPRSENSSESIHAESLWYEHVRVTLVLPTQRTQVSSQRQWLKCGGDRFPTLVSDLETFDLHSRLHANWKSKKFARLHASQYFQRMKHTNTVHAAKTLIFIPPSLPPPKKM